MYVNINLVAMDGGWKSTAIGLASYRSLRHHHNPATMEASHSFMDQHHSELHHSTWRMGKVLVDTGVKVFQIETTLNTDTFPSPFDFLSKREWEWTAADRASYLGDGEVARAPDPCWRAQDPPLDRGAAPDDEHPVRRGRGRAPSAPPTSSTASSSSRSRARPTS